MSEPPEEEMKPDDQLKIAITGANGNLGRKLIAAFLKAPDIVGIRALDRDAAGFAAPGHPRLVPVTIDLRNHMLDDAVAELDDVVHLAAQNPCQEPFWRENSLRTTSGP